MKQDARGLPISTDSDHVVDAIDHFTVDFLAARTSAGAMLVLAEEHPTCAVPQLYAAALHVYLQSTAHLACSANPLLARVAALRTSLNERERLLAGAVEAACAGHYAQALTHCEAITARWPRDVVAAKFAEFMFYMAPDYTRHMRFMERIAAANQGFSHFEAMHAFALGLGGEHARAERVAELAIEHDPDTPWAHHALAHQLLQQGRIAEGFSMLERFAPSWAPHVRSMQCHNTWHMGLFQLADMRLDDVRATLCGRIMGFDAADPQEHVDAISLLWRFELAGGSAGDEWQVLAAQVAARAREQVFPFLSAHYCYALARGGSADAAHAGCAQMAAFAEQQQDEARRAWRTVAVPLVQGCLAFADSDYIRCAVLLEPIMADVVCAGGSDAQNDLFAMTYLVALIRAGRHAEARALLQRRIGNRRPTALEQHWLAQT
jgi:hypothetical protein